MKKLFTLSQPHSHSQRIVYASLAFFSLFLLLYFTPGGIISEQVGGKEKSLNSLIPADEISICGPASFGGGNNFSFASFFQENFVYAGNEQITWSQVAPQSIGNTEGQSVVIGGKMYMFGGFDKKKACCTPTERAWVFDPKANTWKRLADMPPMNDTGHGGVTHSGFTTDGTDVYFAGGYTSNKSGAGQLFGTVEVWKYSVAGNSYSRLPSSL